jgi:Protein of unknown function (DUF3288)
MSDQNIDQKHPQHRRDRATVDSLLAVSDQPGDRDLAELGRLIIRYRDFPGARDIQRDLSIVLHNWQLTIEELYVKTREIHASGMVYRKTVTGEEQDWT